MSETEPEESPFTLKEAPIIGSPDESVIFPLMTCSEPTDFFACIKIDGVKQNSSKNNTESDFDFRKLVVIIYLDFKVISIILL
jgi:hypothetical protein